MIIGIASRDDIDSIERYYDLCEYKGGFKEDDTILLARNYQNREIIGAVRICTENTYLTLRGMQIHPRFQRTKIGTLLLKECDRIISDNVCYVLPYRKLEDFYAQIGFKKISGRKVPRELTERAKTYRKLGNEIIIMKKSNK